MTSDQKAGQESPCYQALLHRSFPPIICVRLVLGRHESVLLSVRRVHHGRDTPTYCFRADHFVAIACDRHRGTESLHAYFHATILPR